MYHFFVLPEQIKETEVWIEGSDVNHIRNVLRMAPGEQITVSSREDGAKEYRCRLVKTEENRVTAEIMWVEESGRELPSKICLLQGLPKSDKMELIVQKAVELGVFEIVPVAAGRSVVKLDKKKEEAKLRRWNAVAESAAKQAKRQIIPEVKGVMGFKEAATYASENYDIKLIPYELAEGMEYTRKLFAQIEPGRSAAVFIGPEGGFEREEIAFAKQKGICPVTLGKRILRTETAGMAVLSALMIQLER